MAEADLKVHSDASGGTGLEYFIKTGGMPRNGPQLGYKDWYSERYTTLGILSHFGSSNYLRNIFWKQKSAVL